ncbi:G-box-binding factor 4-like [Lycium ferocissimum]|uniref:G-box-binding factor 4-like n=1 Tax=Lycium ferocissimum TaxID=112874 RepID=UPI00281652B3|nr:G-box-binding factor 4-like [Lycium ferocissimum]
MASTKLISDRRKSSAASSSSSSTIPYDMQNNQQYSNNGSGNLEATSITVDGIFSNNNNNTEITLLDAAGAITPISDSETAITPVSAIPAVRRTVDDVWREIVEGKKRCKEEKVDEIMTLEDFLVKAGAVEEEDVVAGPAVKVEQLGSGGIYTFDNSNDNNTAYMAAMPVQSVQGGFVGRGKRKVVVEQLDKAAMQRQRRMIKNRESAARSRERKQAYQVELESIAVRLEEENEQLLKEKEERTRSRYKQLIEKVIPVVEKRKPPRVLRRVCSMQW